MVVVDGEVEQRGIFGTGVPRRGDQEPGRMKLGVLVLVGVTAQGQVPGQEDLHLHQQFFSLPGCVVRTGGLATDHTCTFPWDGFRD